MVTRFGIGDFRISKSPLGTAMEGFGYNNKNQIEKEDWKMRHVSVNGCTTSNLSVEWALTCMF